ncbi:MAG: phenylalanine--tRNA ligase subunit beta [Bacteroidota bacterium]
MNISTNWLADYVEHDLAPDDLAEALTMLGLEVESVETHGRDLGGVVVGHVLYTQQHPNADRLRLCEVDLGPEHSADGSPVQIVCGAPNVATGQKVPVATVGTTLMLPSRKTGELEPVTLKKAKLRGEESNGMICAEDELGLGTDHDGILVLDADAPAGQPFADYLAERGRTASDAVLDVAITPNRPDAVSHIGVARDVAAVTEGSLTKPEVEIPAPGGEAAEAFAVEIEAPEVCHRYVGMLVRGVTVDESSDWLKARLEAVGLRPRNNVVDATNYVMHEVGQPLHAFDFQTLAGAKIVVRQTEGEATFTTLDDAERTLPAGTLMICDAERPVAIAGVMGGQNSEVSDATTDVLIESAYFDPTSVRTTAKALGMQTDASYRFERGVDPAGQAWAAARAAELIRDLAGGTIVPGSVDAHPVPPEPREVTLRPSRLTRLLGVEIPTGEVKRLLTAIGFQIEDAGANLKATVPTFRPDVEREIDVIEEVARLWGFDRVPTPGGAVVPYAPPRPDRAAQLRERVRQHLVGLGFREVYTNSLIPAPTAAAFADVELVGVEMDPVETVNAISREMNALRPSLLPGLLGAMAYNQNRDAGALRFFEFGHVYGRTDSPANVIEGYHEHTALILGMSGPAQVSGADQDERGVDFFDLKGVVQHLLRSLGIEDTGEVAGPEANERTAYRLFLDYAGQRLGVLARTSDALGEASDLQETVYFAELNWNALAGLLTARPATRYAPISRAPAVDRDLAVIVEQSAPVGPLLATIRTAGGDLLQSVRVFDLYEGDRIEAGKKSVAFALRFGADKTLTDKVVDKRVRAIVDRLGREHGAELRG